MDKTLGSQYSKMTRGKKEEGKGGGETEKSREKSRREGEKREGKERREEGIGEGEKVKRKNTRAIEAGILK